MYKRGRCNREIVIIETAKISIAKVRREKRQRFVCPSGGGKESERETDRHRCTYLCTESF